MPHHVTLSNDTKYPKWEHSGIRVRKPHEKIEFRVASMIEIDRDKFIEYLKKQRALVKFDVIKSGNKHYLAINEYGFIPEKNRGGVE